jgi:hypothetical protein
MAESLERDLPDSRAGPHETTADTAGTSRIIGPAPRRSMAHEMGSVLPEVRQAEAV